LKKENRKLQEVILRKDREIERTKKDLTKKEEDLKTLEGKSREQTNDLESSIHNDYQRRVSPGEDRLKASFPSRRPTDSIQQYASQQHNDDKKDPLLASNASSKIGEVPRVKLQILDKSRGESIRLKTSHHRISEIKELKKSKDRIPSQTEDELLDARINNRTPDKNALENAYMLDFYKKRVDNKSNELTKLRQRINQIQTDISLKKSFSKEKVPYSDEKAKTMLPVHQRSKSSNSNYHNNTIERKRTLEEEGLIIKENFLESLLDKSSAKSSKGRKDLTSIEQLQLQMMRQSPILIDRTIEYQQAPGQQSLIVV